MASVHTRSRILLILRLLYEKSDEENPLTTNDIFEYLAEHNITADRKTFKEDMSFLIDEMGYDIVMIKSSPNKYFWGERKFELPELKLLIDAVSSAHFIDKAKSKTIIDKLISLAGEGQRAQLVRNVFGTGKIKSDNHKIYYIVDDINNAINQEKKIQFQYYEYNARKEKVLRNDGEVYVISPYALYWNEDNYYVVGYSDKREAITAFRVDRMSGTKIINEGAVNRPNDFDIADYGKKIFRMYDGEETIVTLECRNEVMKYIIDQFGADVETKVKTADTFIVKAPVDLSPTFYGWVFQFAGKITILEPEEASSDFHNMLRMQQL